LRRAALALVGLSVAWVAQGARAGVMTFEDFASFQAASPALVIETFEGGVLGQGVTRLGFTNLNEFAPPLNSPTDNAVFAAGSVRPGFTITDQPGPGRDGALFAARFFDVGVGANLLNDPLVVSFDTPTTAVGFDYLLLDGSGDVDISFFSVDDPFGDPLLVFSGNAGTPEPSFLGLISDDVAIARVVLASRTGRSVAIDNLAFVPEPHALSLLSLALATLVAGALGARRSAGRLGRPIRSQLRRVPPVLLSRRG